VRNGHAWVYRQYAKDKSLFALEAKAKAEKLGLWALPESQRVPPWDWRRGGGQRVETTAAATSDEAFRCGAKSRCGEMRSCEEAKFYLKKCGVASLDGDGDGVPCEGVCWCESAEK